MRFRSLVFTILLLSVFGVHCYGEVSKRGSKPGLGYRIGYVYDQTSFGSGGQDYISYSPSVNYIDGVRIPFFFQPGGTIGTYSLEENLLLDFVYSGWFFDFRIDSVLDMPPVLIGKKYSELIYENSSGGDISIQSSQTFISTFSSKFPQYSPVIDSLSEPSLSADFDINNMAFGPVFGAFIPYGKLFRKAFGEKGYPFSIRFLTVGLGLGISFSLGEYEINLCDPYVISGNETKPRYSDSYRKGSCLNKRNPYIKTISNIGFAIYNSLKGFSFISENWELHFVERETYTVTTFEPLNSGEDVIKPKFTGEYLNFFSFIYKFNWQS